jgi:hypothetical protein
LWKIAESASRFMLSNAPTQWCRANEGQFETEWRSRHPLLASC